MIRVLILVEGQTEETVVRDVLDPYLAKKGIGLVPVILKTKRQKSGLTFKGGITSFGQVQRDLRLLFTDSSAKAVTTLLDYYGLPDDFPGTHDRPAGDPYKRVAHVERAFRTTVNDPRFIPHLTLHELEAWVYVNPEAAGWAFGSAETPRRLAEIRRSCGAPELIDEGVATAPSKRILRLEPSYQKAFLSPLLISAVGVEKIRIACPHADAWLTRIERLSS